MLQRLAAFGYRLLNKHRVSKKKSAVSDSNLVANRAFDENARKRFYRNRFVTDQRILRNFKLGYSDMAYAGCEIIAVFNACELCRNIAYRDKDLGSKACDPAEMLLLDKIQGNFIPFSDMIRRAETGGYLVRFGKWGTNPLRLPEYASRYGLRLERLSNVLPHREGIYILSFWNSKKLMSGVHTVCIEIVGDTVVTYNLHYSDSPISYSHGKVTSEFREKRLIAVYRVSRG